MAEKSDHDLLREHEWRLNALDIWRDKVDSWRGGVDRDLNVMQEDAAVEKRAREIVRKERTVQFTWTQRIVALIVGGVAVAQGIHTFLH